LTIVSPTAFTRLARANNHREISLASCFNDPIGVITTIGQQRLPMNKVEEILGQRSLMRLAWCRPNLNGQGLHCHNRVKFR
jgi:hypothetical protein